MTDDWCTTTLIVQILQYLVSLTPLMSLRCFLPPPCQIFFDFRCPVSRSPRKPHMSTSPVHDPDCTVFSVVPDDPPSIQQLQIPPARSPRFTYSSYRLSGSKIAASSKRLTLPIARGGTASRKRRKVGAEQGLEVVVRASCQRGLLDQPSNGVAFVVAAHNYSAKTLGLKEVVQKLSNEAWSGSTNPLRCSSDSEPIGTGIQEHGETVVLNRQHRTRATLPSAF